MAEQLEPVESPLMSMRDIIMRNYKMRHDHSQKFRRIFHTGFEKFFDAVYGFDVIEFDEWLQTPDGTSTRDHIAAKYGEEAAALVESFLH